MQSQSNIFKKWKVRDASLYEVDALVTPPNNVFDQLSILDYVNSVILKDISFVFFLCISWPNLNSRKCHNPPPNFAGLISGWLAIIPSNNSAYDWLNIRENNLE